MTNKEITNDTRYYPELIQGYFSRIPREPLLAFDSFDSLVLEQGIGLLLDTLLFQDSTLKTMADHGKPTSHIPRLSQLPRPSQIGSRKSTVGNPDAASLRIPKSRPQQPRATHIRDESLVTPLPSTTRRDEEIAEASATEETLGHGPELAVEPLQHPEPRRLAPRKIRPSLSDRAKETLSTIPPSPSPRRRQSGFFPTDSPAIRAPSALARIRPVTSAGFYPPLPTSRPASPIKHPPLPTSRASSLSKKPISNAPRGIDALGQPTQRFPLRTSRIAESETSQKPSLEGEPSVWRPTADKPPTQEKSKHAAGRLPSVKPLRPALGSKVANSSTRKPKGQTSISKGDNEDEPTSPAPPKSILRSSAALRETIANARKAARAAPKYNADDVVKPVNAPYRFDQPDVDDSQHINPLRRRITAARTDGKLNISSMKLKTFPQEVLKMYELDSLGDGGPTWYESVDLTRLNASDNEFEELEWRLFDEKAGDDGPTAEMKADIFSTLQTLDLHGNRLKSLPSALSDFQYLTVLNLSRNKLKTSLLTIVDTIGPIASLRELYLAENEFSGPLPPFDECTNIEILDLHSNAFTALPEELRECAKLRKLDLSHNKFKTLPHLELASLTTLNLAFNPLNTEEGEHPLKDISAPNLASLDLSHCRLQSLPAFPAAFPKLKELMANDNCITMLEVGMVEGLEVFDVRNNDLGALPPGLGLLEGLKGLRVAGNPMRVPRREVLEGSTERLLEWLKGRLPVMDNGVDGVDGEGMF
ncbi:MAG: hypothetical protein L6R37_005995 [Teloschistes peruensis]|nr:MAG: hypothetical protein L6R37_005995 [Teloschistes peruensis]